MILRLLVVPALHRAQTSSRASTATLVPCEPLQPTRALRLALRHIRRDPLRLNSQQGPQRHQHLPQYIYRYRTRPHLVDTVNGRRTRTLRITSPDAQILQQIGALEDPTLRLVTFQLQLPHLIPGGHTNPIDADVLQDLRPGATYNRAIDLELLDDLEPGDTPFNPLRID